MSVIKYNNNNINDWNFGTSNVIKVYRNNAVCFYKVVGGGDTPTYKLCYAVVNDIADYEGTEFVDVYDSTSKKWYKRNNLNQYEEYGVYGDSTASTETYYDGKLAVVNGYEYESSNGSWVNIGEVGGGGVKTNDFTISDMDESAITSDLSLIEDGMYGVILPVSLSANTSSATALMGSSNSNTLSNLSAHTMSSSISEDDVIDYAVWQFHSASSTNTFYIQNVGTSKYFGYSNVSSSNSLPLVDDGAKVPVILSAFTKNNVTAIGICKGNTPNRYYAINDLYAYHYQYNWFNRLSNAGDLNNSYVIYKMSGGGTVVYPKYYAEKSDPLNDLTFNTLEDAEYYAYNNCVYDGMKAVINGDRYTFDSVDGWVKVLEYYKVEDVTASSQGGAGWTISGSTDYNPMPSYYDDFSVSIDTSTSYYKVAKVTFYGYEHFTYYLRSYGYVASYGYAVATNIDEFETPPTSMTYNSISAITNTYNFNSTKKDAVSLNKYRRVTFNNLDKTVEHTFYVVFFGRRYSTNNSDATILIPKEQTNENWEQVTFSSSTNVGNSQKVLYIDGDYYSSGGTNNFYSRWIVGLPSGGHTSSVSYSSVNFCPIVSSATFTSVEGNTRQVDYTYQTYPSKQMSFRLTDGNGTVLTPTDSVYMALNSYNPCGVSQSTTYNFPVSANVISSGKFSFSNSLNRHYIYGYESPSLNYMYNVNDYGNTFDIVYNKLNDEAVTITYTTYDPDDVEVPEFTTTITYPYNGSSTSSTTLTSFDVPYTYSYVVGETNNKFSAQNQTFTANQASRTISITLYPDNREFATLADLESYAYAWEGMNAKVGETNYKYENGEWVRSGNRLPDVPFVVNYNAKNYNATTHTIAKTEGQLNNMDAVISGTTANIIDHSSNGYIELTGTTSVEIRAVISNSSTNQYFNRTSSTPNITIIAKVLTRSGIEGSIIVNRNSTTYNWMYRHKSGTLTFHGTSEQGSITVSSSEPNICSVRVDSNRLLTYNNYTIGTSSTRSSFTYGSTTSNNGGALFSGYSNYNGGGEFWKGLFYWVYMSQNTLTDEQVQQVIDYNENL